MVGPQAKPYCAIDATVKLADDSQYATAVLPNAKVRRSWLLSGWQYHLHASPRL